MAKYERTEDGVRLITNPVSLDLGGLEVVIQSVYTVIEGEGKVITERRILNDLGGESVTFNEYFTGGFGTTEYQSDMTSLTLGVDSDEMQYSYHGKRIIKKNADRAFVNIPDVMTVVEMGGDNDEAEVEEGIAFSPVYHIGLKKTISKGAVKTWLNLRKAN
jgi:hypothetical protein